MLSQGLKNTVWIALRVPLNECISGSWGQAIYKLSIPWHLSEASCEPNGDQITREEIILQSSNWEDALSSNQKINGHIVWMFLNLAMCQIDPSPHSSTIVKWCECKRNIPQNSYRFWHKVNCEENKYNFISFPLEKISWVIPILTLLFCFSKTDFPPTMSLE